jgi:hypothetical protein
VIEYLEDDDGECVGLDMYSSKTAARIFKKSKWGEMAQVTFEKSETMFLKGCLHYMGVCDGWPSYTCRGYGGEDMEKNS